MIATDNDGAVEVAPHGAEDSGIYMWKLPPNVDREQWIEEHAVKEFRQGWRRGEFARLLDVGCVLVGIIPGHSPEGYKYPLIDVDMRYAGRRQPFWHVMLPQSDYLYLRRAGEIALDDETGRPFTQASVSCADMLGIVPIRVVTGIG